MRRNTIALTWAGGLVLAGCVYLTGPDRFLAVTTDFLAHFEDNLLALLSRLGAQAFDVVRSLAIALFVIFVVLAVLALRRGLRARAALIVVTSVFLALVWRPNSAYGPPSGHWVGALVLAAFGALVMTRRLLASQAGPPVGLR